MAWKWFQQSYLWKVFRQIWKECWSFGRDQIMPVFIAIAGAWAAIHYGIIPVDQTRAAYLSFILPFGFGLALYLVFQVIRAPFVLHHQQERHIRHLKSELEKAQASSQTDIGKLLGGHLKDESQRRHTEAMEHLAREMERQRIPRISKMLMGEKSPIATVQFRYEDAHVYVLVTNSGRIADFHGSFDVIGPVTARRQRGLPCRWENGNSAKLRIAHGETCRIILAQLISTGSGQFLTTQWKLYSSPEHEEPEFSAIQSSAVSLRPPALANPLLVNISVMADPDLANGIQGLNIVLASSGARLAQREELPNV